MGEKTLSVTTDQPQTLKNGKYCEMKLQLNEHRFIYGQKVRETLRTFIVYELWEGINAE